MEKEEYYFKILTNKWNRDGVSDKKIAKIKKNSLMNSKESIYPFLKWAGGKRQLIPQMKKFFPKKFKNYIEPFVGGGAVFFYLFRNKYIRNKALLIDINKDLINCYKIIKNNPEGLIEKLKIHAKHKTDKNYYYKIRSLDRDPESYNKLSNTEKAARILYMNKVCYNGLYRVNSKGQFNVPFGRYKNPTICNEENIRAVNKALQNVDIICGSFELSLKFAKARDFIYLDPPYHPISETASFTSYSKEDFYKESQKKLAEVFKELNNRGCYALLNNSNTDFIKNLYSNFKMAELKAKRAINSKASKRGKIKEIIVLNDNISKENL